ncbi:MAG: hypothetical protein GQ576_03025 [Methanococcoides sp.]|nr:hypothetical protein [Methanococcoides sp.]
MSIVVVSDVHLGTDEANEEKFIKFLKELDFEKIEHFVLLGDIIDIWRRDLQKQLLNVPDH